LFYKGNPCTFTACLIALLAGSVLSAQDKSAQDAAGLADAYRGQVLALRRGDVLFRVDKFSDTTLHAKPDQDVTETSVYHRWIFDHDAGNYFYFQSGERRETEVGDEPSGGPLEKSSRSMHGFVYTSSGAVGWMRPNSPGPMVHDLSKLMRSFETPSLTTLGFLPFGAMAPQGLDSGRIAEAFSTVGAAKLSRPAGDDEQILTFGRTLGGSASFEAVWRFDLRRNVPLMVHAYTVGLDAEGVTRRGLNYRETFEWEERSGAVIPVAIQMDRPVARRIAEGQGGGDVSTHHTDVKFHWFKINEDLDLSFFDPAIIRDSQRLLRLADPAATNATSLLDDAEASSGGAATAP
jgi:hypothetical protein